MWYKSAKYIDSPEFWQRMVQENQSGKRPADLSKEHDIPYRFLTDKLRQYNGGQKPLRVPKHQTVITDQVFEKMKERALQGAGLGELSQEFNIPSYLINQAFYTRRVNLKELSSRKNHANFRQMYEENVKGSSLLAISRKYNISVTLLRNLFAKNKLKPVVHSQEKVVMFAKKQGSDLVAKKDPIVQKVIDLYRSGLAPHDISVKLGIEQYVIMGIFHAAGIAITKGFVHKHDPGNISKMIDMYRQKRSFQQIAEAFGTTNQQAQKVLLRNLPPQEANKLRQMFLKKESEKNKKQLHEALRLYNEGLSFDKVAKQLGVSTSRVKRALDLLGGTPREGKAWQNSEPITDPKIIEMVSNYVRQGLDDESISRGTGIEVQLIRSIRNQVFNRSKAANSWYGRIAN